MPLAVNRKSVVADRKLIVEDADSRNFNVAREEEASPLRASLKDPGEI